MTTTRTRRFAETLGIVWCLAFIIFLIGTTIMPVVTAAEPLEDYLAEVDPTAVNQEENLQHWQDFILDHVDADADQRADQPPPDAALMTKIDIIWLRLTREQIAEADKLLGASPIVHGGAATEMSIPTPVDGGGPLGGAGHNGIQVNPTGRMRIGAPEPQGTARRDGLSTPAVKVGVSGTGIDARHDDLNVVDGYNCTLDNRGPDGWGFDDHGHETHVGGIIGAIDNDRFTVGVAPGAALYSLVSLSGGSGTSATVLCTVNQALEFGVDVLNLSLGGTHPATPCGGADPYTNGFCKAHEQGLVIVAAAGNDAADAIAKGPANAPGVVSVSAVVDFDGLPGGAGPGLPGCGLGHPDDYLASFSNYGSVVDIAAPGGCILSLFPQNSWGYASGTSMAAPMVTGAIAAFMSRCSYVRGEDAVEAVLGWSEMPEWTEGDGYWAGDKGPDTEALLRYGAGCNQERELANARSDR